MARLGFPAPPRAGAARYALALVGPFALVLLGCKIDKFLRVDPAGVPVGVGLDLVFVVLLFAATALALDRLPRALRRAFVPLMHVVVLLATGLAAVEHVFFLTTGSLLDAHLVGYTVAHFGALSEVLASEVSAPVVVGGVALALANLLPLALGGRRWLASLDAPREATPARWRSPRAAVFGLALTAVAVAGAASATGALPGRAEPLRDTVFASLIAGALAPEGDAPAPAAAPPGEAPAAADDADDAIRLSDAPGAARPNVLIVVMESTRAEATTVYEPALGTTPALVALAARGAVVDTAYTTVTHTTKALTSILCGIYPLLDTGSAEAGPEGLPVPCLPQILGKRGYQSAFFQPATALFEGRDRLVENFGFGRLVAKEQLSPRFELSSYFGYEDDALVDPVLDWVRARQGTPFLATVLTLASHHKYNVPRSIERRPFADKPLVDDYLNAVHYTDRFIGKLLAGLDALGHRDDTVVIVVGDHGEGFGEHGRSQHDTVIYEEGLRVPFIVAGPGIAPGSHVGGLRQLIDVTPTVLDLVGVEVLGGYPGESVRAPGGHAQIFASCWYKNRCMATREGSRKTIFHFDRRPPEVFDLAADPGETHDLVAAKEVSAAEVKRAVAALEAWKRRVNSRFERHFQAFAAEQVLNRPPSPQVPMSVWLGPRLEIVGVDAPSTTIAQGDPLELTLHLHCVEALGERFRLFMHLFGASPGAKPFTNFDHVPVNGHHPTSEWRPGQYIADELRVQPSKPLPLGDYVVTVGLYDSEATAPAERFVPIGFGASIDFQHRSARVLRFSVVARETPWGFGGGAPVAGEAPSGAAAPAPAEAPRELPPRAPEETKAPPAPAR